MASGSTRFPGTMIMLSRLVYAMNWYNLSPAIDVIAKDFGVSFSGTSQMFSFFLIGAGVFQIPAGILATKVGSKRVAMSGLFIMAAASIVATFSPSYSILVFLRGVTGFAAAFFFSSAIGILNELYGRDITKMVGIYNGFFAIGGGVGVFLFTPIVQVFGWRADSLVAGVVTLIVAIVTYISLPRTRIQGDFDLSKIKERLTDKTIWLVALGLDGLWGLNFTFSEYFKTYAIYIGMPEIIAGLMGGMILFLGVVGGYLTGSMRRFKPLYMVTLFTAFIGLGVALIPFLSGLLLWIPVIIDGVLAVIVISTEYGILIRLDRDPRYVPLSLGTVNTIQIAVGSLFPLTFASLNVTSYTPSWIFLGVASVSLLPLLWIVLRGRYE